MKTEAIIAKDNLKQGLFFIEKQIAYCVIRINVFSYTLYFENFIQIQNIQALKHLYILAYRLFKLAPIAYLHRPAYLILNISHRAVHFVPYICF